MGIYATTKCDRCGLRYRRYLDACDICGDMDESDVEVLRHRHRKEMEEAGRLGKYFLFLAIIIFLLLAALSDV